MAQQEDSKAEEVQPKGPRVYVSGTFECVSKEHIKTFKTLFRRVVAITNKEKGCIQYNVHQDNKNECLFALFEEWECQEDLTAHSKGAHLAPIRTEKFKEIVKSDIHFCQAPPFLGKDDLTGLAIPKMDVFTFNAGPSKVSTTDIFAGKKVVVFAVPGSFTPDCQEKHAPTFVEKYDEFMKMGVDKVYCLAVNDVFVLRAFVKKIGGEDKIDIISDFDASFVKALGDKCFDGSGFSLGVRAMRFAFYAVNGVVEQYFEEAIPSDVLVADAGTLIDAMNITASFESK